MNNTYPLNSVAQKYFDELSIGQHSNLLALFDETCANFSDKVAFYCVDEQITFGELNEQSRALAGYLEHTLGLKPGDRIAIQLPNILAYPIAAWAAWRAGLVIVNTNPMYTVPELTHQMNDSGARAIITLNDLLPVVTEVMKKSPLERIVVANLPGIESSSEPLPEDVVRFETGLELGRGTQCSNPELSMEHVAVLQYTSGTTGLSKGAVLTQANLYSSSVMTKHMFNDPTPETAMVIAPMPLYHIYGFTGNVLNVFAGGGTSVLIPNARNIDSLIDAFLSYPVTSIAGVNTLYVAMLGHPKFDEIDFSHFRFAVSGGATLVKEVSDEWIERTGTRIFEGYGLSETSSVLACNSEDFNQLGSVGRALSFQELRVVNSEGQDVEPGEAGEIWVRGPQVMVGYWDRPDATREVLDAEGWFRTGDVAVIQDGGFIRIVDRLKDMIIVSGFNVYPNEVEAVLYNNADVVECAVVGRKDDRSGEAVVAYVVSANSDLTAEKLQDFCRASLAAYKVPKEIKFVDELPKSNVGKILRRALRD